MTILRFVLIALILAVLQGCASQGCDKVRPYQTVVASEPLRVPADLTEPPMRDQAPEVAPDAPTRRADGGCIDLPPPFEPQDKENRS